VRGSAGGNVQPARVRQGMPRFVVPPFGADMIQPVSQPRRPTPRARAPRPRTRRLDQHARTVCLSASRSRLSSRSRSAVAGRWCAPAAARRRCKTQGRPGLSGGSPRCAATARRRARLGHELLIARHRRDGAAQCTFSDHMVHRPPQRVKTTLVSRHLVAGPLGRSGLSCPSPSPHAGRCNALHQYPRCRWPPNPESTHRPVGQVLTGPAQSVVAFRAFSWPEARPTLCWNP
jgi:hypothetical protein